MLRFFLRSSFMRSLSLSLYLYFDVSVCVCVCVYVYAFIGLFDFLQLVMLFYFHVSRSNETILQLNTLKSNPIELKIFFFALSLIHSLVSLLLFALEMFYCNNVFEIHPVQNRE